MNKALCILLIILCAGAVRAADSDRTFVTPPGADPKAAPPYSSGVLVKGTYYVSGSLGVDPATGKVPADAEAEARSGPGFRKADLGARRTEDGRSGVGDDLLHRP